MVPEAASLEFQDDGEAVTHSERQATVSVAVKQEKEEDPAKYGNCNGRSALATVPKVLSDRKCCSILSALA